MLFGYLPSIACAGEYYTYASVYSYTSTSSARSYTDVSTSYSVRDVNRYDCSVALFQVSVPIDVSITCECSNYSSASTCYLRAKIYDSDPRLSSAPSSVFEVSDFRNNSFEIPWYNGSNHPYGKTYWVMVYNVPQYLTSYSGTFSASFDLTFHRTEGGSSGGGDNPSVGGTQTVTFNANGGVCSSSSRGYAIGSTYEFLPSATKSGYTFNGWWTMSTGGTHIMVDSTVSSSPTLTLYAHWTPAVIAVTSPSDIDEYGHFHARVPAAGGTATVVLKNYGTSSMWINCVGNIEWAPSSSGYSQSTTIAAGSSHTFSWAVKKNTTGNDRSGVVNFYNADKSVMIIGYINQKGVDTANQSVTFDANGGSCSTSTRTYTVGGTYSSLPTATRTGYLFNGWYTSSSGGTRITTSSSVSSSSTRTLYAQWTANTYTVTLDRQSGSGGSSSVTATYGQSMPSITVPTRTGYTFGGYYTSTGGSGTQYYTSSGASARSWDKTSATTLYAKWTANTCTVTLDRQSGSGGSSSVTATYGQAMPSITVPTRSGYTFGGYYTSTGGSGTQYYTSSGASARSWDKTSATTLYAKWTQDAPTSQTVTFNANGGSCSTSTQTYTIGGTYSSLPSATRTGYAFNGWFTSSSGGTRITTSSTVSSSSTRTLYAQWTANTYTVTLDRQSGSGGTSSVTATYGQSMPSITVPTRTGYTFGGYYTSTGGSGTQYYTSSGASARSWDKTSATTLYAKWTQDAPTSQTVTFNANGGSCSTSTQTYTIGGTYSSLPAATRTGYAFNGWYTSSSGGTRITTSSTVSSSTTMTLYAQWTANTYTVTYNYDGGTKGSNNPSSGTYDSAFYVSAPTKSDSTFAGWTVTSGLDASTAKWGSSSSPANAISSSSTKCLNGTSGNVYFKNLRSTAGGVTLKANWEQPALDAPTNVSASDGTYTDKIYITWGPVSGATYYEIYRSTSASGEKRSIGSNAVPAFSDEDGSLVVGTTYYYWIKAVNSAGTSGFSSYDTGSLKPTSSTLPDLAFVLPTGNDWPASCFLSGSADSKSIQTSFCEGDTIRLYCSFGNSGGSAISSDYVITHEVLDGSGATISFVPCDCSGSIYHLDPGGVLFWEAVTFAVPSTLPIGDYTYRCTLDSNGALGELDESNNRREIRFSVVQKVSPPSAPTGVSASDGASTANVTVSWTADSGATSYQVYRATSSSGTKTLLGSTASTTYTDTSATPGTLYYYWIKATNTAGTSGFSSTNSGYRKIAAPSISSVVGNSTGLALQWAAVTGATHYRICRASSATGSKTQVGGWQTGLTFTDTTVTTGRTYYYFVQAAATSSGGRSSDFSAARSATSTLALFPVHRFYSKNYKGHFYTIDEAEKNSLIATNPNWKYEGIAYYAYTEQTSGTVPLYRFYSKAYRGHFFTIDEAEMQTVRNTNPNWKYEGVAYYVRPTTATGASPIYRFWSKGYRHHFYTMDYEEMVTLRDTNPNWKYETVAFYAWSSRNTSLAPAQKTVGKQAIPAADVEADTGKLGEDVSGDGIDRFVVTDEGAFPAGPFMLEVQSETPDATELTWSHFAAAGRDAPILALRIALPAGEASLWSAADGEQEAGPIHDGFLDFDLPVDNVWRWFHATDESGNESVSVWLRALTD